MITEDKFWNLIERSINEKNSIDKSEQGDCLLYILAKLSVEEIVGFHKRMMVLRKELDSSILKDIAYTQGYENDHAYEGFRNWIISLGKDYYLKAKESPMFLLTIKDETLFVAHRSYFPDLNFVASGAFYEKEGLDADWEDQLKYYN